MSIGRLQIGRSVTAGAIIRFARTARNFLLRRPYRIITLDDPVGIIALDDPVGIIALDDPVGIIALDDPVRIIQPSPYFRADARG